MSRLFSALVGLSMLGLVGAASAAEPVALSAAQLDSVNAGFFGGTAPPPPPPVNKLTRPAWMAPVR